MLTKMIFILSFLLAVMVLTPSQGQCENWKEFFKDGDTIWQYDKDSIHYPKTKKNFFGLTVQNKEIVNVWTQDIKSNYGAFMVRIYCAERECIGCDFGWRNPYSPNELVGSRTPIGPGSPFESLLKKVCP
jgi:hypothetical protein